MDTIELWRSSVKALISREGAWLTNLSDDYGDILFPKRLLKAPDGSYKARGGSHVCLPNFGPGGDSGLSQHGFGRVSLWNVLEQSETFVTLQLKGGAAGYEGLVSTLTYELSEEGLSMNLVVRNESQKTMRLSPAFHPYFALRGDEQVVHVDGEKFLPKELGGTEVRLGDHKELVLQRRRIRITSDQLRVWAIWTDQLGEYICVEPTLRGNAFLEKVPAPEEELHARESRQYQCRIAWEYPLQPV